MKTETKTPGMEYNSQRRQLVIPEYGRHIQKMVEHAIELKDRSERNRAAEAIITLMGQMNPHLRDVSDFTHKLWDHLFIISDFKLDVDSPYPKPDPETIFVKPDKLAYPNKRIKFKHYGNTIQLMVNKAVEMEDGPDKDKFIKAIANLMKKSFLNWNRDSVNDDVILEHLVMLSDGKITPSKDLQLNTTSDILAKSKQKKSRPGADKKGGPKGRGGRKRRK